MGTFWGRSKQSQAIAGAAMLIVTLALVAGCGDSSSVSETSPGTVVGQVVSFATSAPVSGATVKTTSSTSTTAAEGKFSVSAPAGDRTLVRVEATGFAEAFPVVRVTSGQTANLGVKLVPIAATETVSVAAGGTVSVPNSTARVVIPANSLVPQGGGTSAGPVTVSLTPLNPAVDTGLMPGGFNGIAVGGGSAQLIESFGVLLIDIRDSAGTRYNLAQGKTATIRIPLGTQSANSPATIPLWFFDETAGVWREEGTATLQGTGSDRYYEGDITRVTYWNADQILETIVVNGCVKDANSQPVGNVAVQTKGINYTGTASDVTAADGTFSVPMRKNSQANLSVVEFDPQTFALVAASNIVQVGPSAADINLPNCLVKQPGPLTITTTALPGGTVGDAYNQILAASSGVPGYVWSLNTGSNPLPAGLTLNPAGVISGTPTTDGTKTITIKVTDSTGATTTKEFTLAIQKISQLPPPPPPPPSLTITTTGLPGGTVGTAYSAPLASAGGTGTKSWSISAGTLPAGLSLNTATGIISGTPTAAGTSTFTVQVQDSGTPQQSAQKVFDLAITGVPPPSCGTGIVNCLTVSNAPTSVGDTFVANKQPVIKTGQIGLDLVGRDADSIEWSETATPNHGETLSILLDPNNGVTDMVVTFVSQDGFLTKGWSCFKTNAVGGTQCNGLTVNRAAGTATFSNVLLHDLTSQAPSITLNGTLTFTPF